MAVKHHWFGSEVRQQPHQSFKNMPPQRPCLRCSACLSALAQPLGMAGTSSKNQQSSARAWFNSLDNLQPDSKPESSRTGMWGKGKSKAQETTGPLPAASSAKSSTPRPPNIVWDGTCVQELVSWLVTHPTDRYILYHNRNQAGSAPLLPPNQWPSGRQKKDIHAAIAKHIFDSKEPEYLDGSDRYMTSVSNRLTAYVSNPSCTFLT